MRPLRSTVQSTHPRRARPPSSSTPSAKPLGRSIKSTTKNGIRHQTPLRSPVTFATLRPSASTLRHATYQTLPKTTLMTSATNIFKRQQRPGRKSGVGRQETGGSNQRSVIRQSLNSLFTILNSRAAGPSAIIPPPSAALPRRDVRGLRRPSPNLNCPFTHTTIDNSASVKLTIINQQISF